MAKKTPLLPPIGEYERDRVSNGSHHNPHATLGVHPVDGGGWAIRALRPMAKSVSVVLKSGKEVSLTHIWNGIWDGFVDSKSVPDYRIKTTYLQDGKSTEWLADDPYRHLPTIGELDLHLVAEGRHEELWNALGSHVLSIKGDLGISRGTSFKVWAPNAEAVRVVGDFNHWSGVAHSMRVMGSTGVWELFIPGIEAGSAYKYEILTKQGHWIKKIDPMARATQVPPDTASIVTESTHAWKDKTWMSVRAKRDALSSPMSIYELHAGSWKHAMNYRELADELIPYVQQLGFTHVEFMPLAEHPYAPSWGYQVTGYYAPTSRFGSPDDLRYLIDKLHQAGIGVILDWVPAHFPKDDWALARFDGQALYEHADPRRGEHPDWGTYIFDFGRTEVRNFLVANALYWLEEFHIDGLRVDAVASMLYLDYSRENGEWLPNEFGGRENLDAIRFMQETNATAYRRNPGIMMIAEESTSWGGVSAPTDGGGLGFGFKWNMGWMNDTLKYIEKDPMYRKHHHGELTFSMLYAYNEKFVLPISHDEVVHGKGSLLAKMPGDRWQQLANVRAYLAYMWAHPGKQLLFMGSEFGQPSEWNQERGLDWWILEQPTHQALQSMVSTLNRVYLENAAFWQLDHDPAGFVWIDGGNADANLLSFLRVDKAGNQIACVINFAGQPHHNFNLGLPRAGKWNEILNTDAVEYGGSGVGNFGSVEASGPGSHGQPHSATISVPPLAAVWFKPAN
ncbi:MAG: 1,4-alpha-glucan branching protein GlgB [Actinobacteria bacterium]|uniref:1,4-alpha-glucan branching enzyme n=1 Tax=freshwater metagenome TaxID=449393 RepID=A0A6J6HBQ0_9ZZZZ|nr:1,4-alpha-glucan branching protein GlgB [Actinomycetota bacterium]